MYRAFYALHYTVYLISFSPLHSYFFFFFFNDTATTEIYTLSLHDALPILRLRQSACSNPDPEVCRVPVKSWGGSIRMKDRKSTRLNSSHSQISYAVFCLKKKKKDNNTILI